MFARMSYGDGLNMTSLTGKKTNTRMEMWPFCIPTILTRLNFSSAVVDCIVFYELFRLLLQRFFDI